MKKTILAFALAAVVISFAGNAKAQSYNFTPIKPPNAVDGTAIISGAAPASQYSFGGVVGTYSDSSGLMHGFIYNSYTNTYQVVDHPLGVSGTQLTAIGSSGGAALYVGNYLTPNGPQTFYYGIGYIAPYLGFNTVTKTNLIITPTCTDGFSIGGSAYNTMSRSTDDAVLISVIPSNNDSARILNGSNGMPNTASITGIRYGATTANVPTGQKYIVGNYVNANGDSEGFLSLLNGTEFTAINVPDSVYTRVTGISGTTIYGSYIPDIGEPAGFLYNFGANYPNGGVFTTIDNPLANGGFQTITGYADGTAYGYYSIYYPDPNDEENDYSLNYSFMATAVPEPSTYALFGIGAIGMLMVLRRKKTA